MSQPKSGVLETIQDLEDSVINRFCAISRRHACILPWVGETVEFDALEEQIRERICFYEARGYYLFQEPYIEHQPVHKRLRVHLTFRPTENNA